jgi:hypothetical protein
LFTASPAVAFIGTIDAYHAHPHATAVLWARRGARARIEIRRVAGPDLGRVYCEVG